MAKASTPLSSVTLTRVAASMSHRTVEQARSALKAAELPIAPNVEAVIEAHLRLTAARKAAPAHRLARRLGYCPIAHPSRTEATGDARVLYTGEGHPTLHGRVGAVQSRRPSSAAAAGVPVLLPTGTPAHRLEVARCDAVRETYSHTYRTATHGTVCVELTDDPTKVGATQRESLDWNLYRGAQKGRPARVQDTTITVPADWRVRVQRRGLAVVDGMMTLDAAIVESTGCELFAATWLEQGRGTAVTQRRGYIARAGGQTYHGATADLAMTGLARKARAAAISAALASADLNTLVNDHRHMIVRISDARAIGACEYGIRSWCHAVGIDYAAGQASLEVVYAAYTREPRPEARATILRVLRRVRSLAV